MTAGIGRAPFRSGLTTREQRTYVGRAFECCHVLGPRLFPRLTAFRTAIDEVTLEVQRRVAALEAPAVGETVPPPACCLVWICIPCLLSSGAAPAADRTS